jgi:sugar phosphate isomerase/epimerase
MRTSVHIGCTPYTGVEADIGNVRAAEFDGLELTIPKLTRYLTGHTESQLKDALDGFPVTMIDVLMPIEKGGDRSELLEECHRWAALARLLDCPALQVVALNEFEVTTWREQRDVIVDSLRRLADCAFGYGVRLGIEPVCFSPFRCLDQALEVVELVGSERAGLVLDTWHLWVTNVRWGELTRLEPRDIVTVQIGDTGPRRGPDWSDADRTEFPGDGLVPLGEAIDAIVRTGYDGFWSAEMTGDRYRDWDPADLYGALHARLVATLDKSHFRD